MVDRADAREGLRIDRAGPEDLSECLRVRHRVFVQEQGVPLAMERDGHDGDCVHLIARVDDLVVGTARLRELDTVVKAERVAVVETHRGRGVGVALMRALEDLAAERGHTVLSLHAQSSAVPFYTALGYAAEGEAFEEAGIPHLAMVKPLD